MGDYVMKICFRCILAVMVVLVVLAGCLVQPVATDAAAVATYNKHIVDMLTPFIGPLVTILGFVGVALQIAMSRRKADQKAEEVAAKLAESSVERNAKVLEAVGQVKEINVSALTAANNTNEKILALHETVAAGVKRAPARATDKAAVVVVVPPDQVQKVEITGPGVDSALKVEDAKK